ncbi:hypothetical protein AAC387_Pa03g1778 [Persea americana]
MSDRMDGLLLCADGLCRSVSRGVPLGLLVGTDVDAAIGRGGGTVALDSEFSTQPLEATVPELGTIVMYDSSGYSEPVQQVFLYEINGVGCLHFAEWDSLGPFVKVIGGNKYESVTLTGRWGDGFDDVDPPHIKRPRRDSWL